MYFVLASVGLFTLLVGAAVRVRRPRDQATLHFFWLCVAFFGAFTFSFNGPLDRLDWVFYWGDAVAQALLPPLLLHFMLVFPERPGPRAVATARLRAQLAVPLLYLPALALGTGRIVALTRGTANGPLFSRLLGLLDRVAAGRICSSARVVALIVLVRAFRELTSLTARRQTALDCVGHGLRRGAVRVRLRACRGRSASIRRSRCSSRPFRSVSCR